MYIQVISEQEFKDFIDTYDSYMYYFHDSLYYDYISKIQETHLLGLYEEKTLIGVSLLSATSVLRRYRLFTSHTGPLIKEFNNERLEFFLEQIDAYVKKHNALQLIHSPYHVYQFRNNDGEVDDTREHNREIINIYTRLGFTHHGFTKQLTIDELLRHQAVLDIDKSQDELKKDMNSTTRYNTRQVEQMPLRLKMLGEDEYDKFIQIYKETEERIGFDPVPSHKIKNLLHILKARLFVTMSHIDLDEYLAQLNEELQTYEETVGNMRATIDRGEGSKGLKKRLEQEQQQLDSRRRRISKIQEFHEEYGSILELSAAMYYYSNHEMVYLFSGSNPEFSYFKGTNYANWEMIKKAQELGLKRFNFSGLTGDFTEDAKDYGVFKFKKGYGTFIEELPGTFDKVYNRLMYRLAKLLGKI